MDWDCLLTKGLQGMEFPFKDNEIDKIPRFFLAYNLKSIRKKKGLTYKALSEAIKINSNDRLSLHFSNISRIEKMEIDATVSSIFKISVGLGINPSNWYELCGPLEFGGGHGSISKHDIDSDALANCIRKSYEIMSEAGQVDAARLAAMAIATYHFEMSGDIDEYQKRILMVGCM